MVKIFCFLSGLIGMFVWGVDASFFLKSSCSIQKTGCEKKSVSLDIHEYSEKLKEDMQKWSHSYLAVGEHGITDLQDLPGFPGLMGVMSEKGASSIALSRVIDGYLKKLSCVEIVAKLDSFEKYTGLPLLSVIFTVKANNSDDNSSEPDKVSREIRIAPIKANYLGQEVLVVNGTAGYDRRQFEDLPESDFESTETLSTKLLSYVPDVLLLDNTQTKKSDVTFDLAVGYDKRYIKTGAKFGIYYGAEVFANVTPCKFTTKLIKGSQRGVGVDFMIGLASANDWELFGVLGTQYSVVTLKCDKYKQKTGGFNFEYGVGTNYRLSENWFIGVKFVKGSKRTVKIDWPHGREKFDLRQTKVSFSFAYRF